MKLSDQVCTLEQAKKLKELDVIQGVSLFFYDVYDDQANHVIKINSTPNDGYYNAETCFSAFTSSELGVMLPKSSQLSTGFNKDGRAVCRYTPVVFKSYKGRTEASVRAAMLILLLEKNLITVEEINKRLQS
jgi:hypothetical protein